MTRIPELHRLLVQGARFEEEQARRMKRLEEQAGSSRLLALAMRIGARRRAAAIAVSPARIRGEMRRMRVFLLALVALFATTTIALAASGVILTGSPVPANQHLKPKAGLGVPARGASRLLALRVHDPQGGLPWGMRVVHTTRGEVCMQIGRVEDGKLGELGIDGAFGDDRAFHPLPVDALPAGGGGGWGIDDSVGTDYSDVNTSCHLGGFAVETPSVGLDRNAASVGILGIGAPGTHPHRVPSSDLRDVYYGLLGPQAVSVTYRDGSSYRTQDVEPKTGAYLIVLPFSNARRLRGGVTTRSPYGELSPTREEVTKVITYKIDGKLCERGPFNAKGGVPHPCPAEHSSAHPKIAPPRELHEPVHVKLKVRKGIVTGAQVSFVAPYVVRSARENYAIFVPVPSACFDGHEPSSEVGQTTTVDRDVRRGELVSSEWSYPFIADCGKKAVTFDIFYEPTEFSSRRTLVGKIRVKQPPGTEAARPRRHPHVASPRR